MTHEMVSKKRKTKTFEKYDIHTEETVRKAKKSKNVAVKHAWYTHLMHNE